MDTLLAGPVALPAVLVLDGRFPDTVLTDVLVPLFLYQSRPQNRGLLYHPYMPGGYLQSPPGVCQGFEPDQQVAAD